MPENATVAQGVQIAPEVTPGTSVAADTLLNYLGWSASINKQIATFTPMGQKVMSGAALTQNFTDYTLTGDVCSYSEMPYILCSLMKSVTPTTVETTARRWTFEPAARSEDTRQTYTVEKGSASRAGKTTYGIITGGEWTFSRADGLSFSGTAIGQQWQDNITLTASPTAPEDKPIPATHLNVYVDATSGGLGGTKLLRDFTAVFRFNDALGPIWPINSALASYAAHVDLAPTVQMELTVEYDSVGAAYLANADAGDTRFIRLEAISTENAGATSAKYDFKVDMAGKITSVGDFSDVEGVNCLSYTFDAVYDSTWGKFLSIQNTNKLTAL